MEKKYEVVISGMSGKFPECLNVDEFKTKLFEKENLITVDNRRWEPGYFNRAEKMFVPSGVGKINGLDLLDARVFQINHLLGNCYDVLNRIVLEPAYEAVIDAGVNPGSLSGSFTGVYAAWTISEFEGLNMYRRPTLNKFLYVLGSAKTMMANRISFVFNLTGPSCTFSSSFDGGIEALSAAYDNISKGFIDAAIVVASNLILNPLLCISFIQLGSLSPDGLCRAFDENANGYGRSDGVVALYLQRADLAKRIYGTVLFSDHIYLGSNPRSLLYTDEDLMKRSFEELCKQYPINPEELSFLEMNVCGLNHIDSPECNVMADMFCKNRKQPLLVGSVKSNAGHTEATSSLLSIVKTLFALDSDYIPPNIHFTKSNSKIRALTEEKLKVVTEKTNLPGPIVAVNSVGVAGSVGHVVLKQFSKKNIKERKTYTGLPRIMLLFGRTEEGVLNSLNKIESIPFDENFIALGNDVFKIPVQSQLYRGYTILPAIPNAINGVGAAVGTKRPVCFLFSGMGSQWNGMGEDLLRIPIFAAAIDKIDAVLRPRGMDVREIITSQDPKLFDNITNCFVGIISVQIGLVDILNALGIKPDNIIGHSVGETACAYADGCFTAEEAVLSAYSRGMASIEKETIKGLMAAVGKGYSDMQEVLPPNIVVACHNSSDNCTISGPADEVKEFVEKLKSQGIFAKAVNTANIAYHSIHIAPAGPLLHYKLAQVVKNPKPRSSIWVSTSVPEAEWDTDRAKYSSAAYHANNFLNPVLFEEGCKHIPDNAIVIEIAPHGLLQGIVKRSLNSQCINIPLLSKLAPNGNVNFLLSAIGKIYLAGCQPDVNVLYPKVEYPVPRGTPSLAPLCSWDHSDHWDIINKSVELPLSHEIINVNLNKGTEYSYLGCHRIKSHFVIPPSFYMCLTWNRLAIMRNQQVESFTVIFEDIEVFENLNITLEKPRLFTIMIQSGSGNFEVLLTDPNAEIETTVMIGRISVPYDEIKINFPDGLTNSCMKYKFSSEDFYKMLNTFGYELDELFKNVEELSYDNSVCCGKLRWDKNWVALLDSFMKVYMYTDPNEYNENYFPRHILKLTITPDVFSSFELGEKITCYKDRIVNYMVCSGIEMFGLRYNTLDISAFEIKSCSQLQGMQFLAYSEPRIENQLSFVLLSLQIVAEDSLQNRSATAKVYISNISYSDSLIKQIKNITDNDNYLKSRFIYSGAEVTRNISHLERCYLYVANYQDIETAKKLLNSKAKDLYVFIMAYAKISDELNFEPTAVIVTKKSFGDMVLYLIKKVSQVPQTKILMAIDYRKMKNTDDPITVVWDKELWIDLSAVLPHAKSNNIRSVVILDEKAPPFSPHNPIYEKQLIQDLPVAVLKNGEWGSYRNITDVSHEASFANELLSTDFKIDSVAITCFGLNNSSIDTDKKGFKKYNLEYSGFKKSGERIMGLIKYDSKISGRNYQKIDKYLTWNIPKNWNFEQACTIPYIYCQAYNIIQYVLPIHEIIFIYGADTPLGEACITLLKYKGDFKIFTTVAHEQNIAVVKKKFPTILDLHIFVHTDKKYEVDVNSALGENRIDCLINTIRGIKFINVDLHINFCSVYVEINDDPTEYDGNLELQLFLLSLSFFHLSNNIDEIINWPEDTKKSIHASIQKGINDGIIKPFHYQLYEPKGFKGKERCFNLSDKRQILRYVSKSVNSNDSINSVAELKYDGNHSYIIIDGGKTHGWYELVEWLIEQGARKFIIAVENFSINPKISHQINKRIVQLKACIVFTSMRNIESMENAKNIISDARKMGPVEAIFFTHVESSYGSVIQNMDMASRNNKPCHFIGLMSAGLNVCESRSEAGYPAVIINAEKSVTKLSTVLPYLKSLSLKTDYDNMPVLFDFIDSQLSTKDRNAFLLTNFLRADLNMLERVGNLITDRTYFTELKSLSVEYEETKGILPVFAISTNEHYLASLARKIIYPVFSASFPDHFESSSALASSLLEEVKRIQPFGPVNIIGEAWCGCIAIELASLLQSNNRNVRLFLIEGSPIMWQTAINLTGKMNTFQFNNAFLRQMLGFNILTGSYNASRPYSDVNIAWDYLLETYLRDLPEGISKKNVSLAASSIRNTLLAVSQYTPTGEPLKHVVHFKQWNTMPHNPVLEQYCLADDVHLFEEEKYEDFIKNPGIAHVINEQALFSWNLMNS